MQPLIIDTKYWPQPSHTHKTKSWVVRHKNAVCRAKTTASARCCKMVITRCNRPLGAAIQKYQRWLLNACIRTPVSTRVCACKWINKARKHTHTHFAAPQPWGHVCCMYREREDLLCFLIESSSNRQFIRPQRSLHATHTALYTPVNTHNSLSVWVHVKHGQPEHLSRTMHPWERKHRFAITAPASVRCRF